MEKLSGVLECLREMAPEDLAEPWDNCGLIVGSAKEYINSVMVCLDVTPDVVSEAVRTGANLIISHHPLVFNPIKRITDGNPLGIRLRTLIMNDVAVYAAHTNVDKTYGGLNDLLAGIIGLKTDLPDSVNDSTGCCRFGSLPYALAADEFNEYVSKRLKQTCFITTSAVYSSGRLIEKVVVMCGSCALDVDAILTMGADAVVCGEMRYHDALDLSLGGMHVVQAGHHETERFFVNLIKKWIKDKYPDLEIRCAGFSNPPMAFYNAKNMF